MVRDKAKALARLLFASRLSPPWKLDRLDVAAFAAGALLAILIAIYKLINFYGLSYTSDLFVNVQLARGWTEGKQILEDNCFGPELGIHTYFLLLPLGLLARPFGAPGLLLTLAVTSGLSLVLAARILRTLGVHGLAALLLAAMLVLSPTGASNIVDWPFAFHVELLWPVLALGLFYALLRRRWVASVVMALLVMSVKEEAPVLAGCIASVVLVEDLLSGRRLNRQAAAVLLLALVMLPLLLGIVASQPPAPYAPNGFSRLVVTKGAGVEGGGSLVSYLWAHKWQWLLGPGVKWWLVRGLGMVTLGLIILRPHLALLGIPLTLVTWLMHDNMLWAPRFAPTLGFGWCLALLGGASLWHAGQALWQRWRPGAWALGAATALLLLGVWRATPPANDKVASLYTLSLVEWYPRAQIAEADRVFARYLREGRSDEPVAATPHLFRYAHDRPLYWLDRLKGRPRPIWVLTDHTFRGFPAAGLVATDYELLAQEGYFRLWKRKVSPR